MSAKTAARALALLARKLTSSILTSALKWERRKRVFASPKTLILC